MIPGQTGVPEANDGALGSHVSSAPGGVDRLDYDEFSLDYVAGSGLTDSSFSPDELIDQPVLPDQAERAAQARSATLATPSSIMRQFAAECSAASLVGLLF
jgi:hypothetical protein